MSINKSMAIFMANFESELNKSNDIENAIETTCSYDSKMLTDYDY